MRWEGVITPDTTVSGGLFAIGLGKARYNSGKCVRSHPHPSGQPCCNRSVSRTPPRAFLCFYLQKRLHQAGWDGWPADRRRDGCRRRLARGSTRRDHRLQGPAASAPPCMSVARWALMADYMYLAVMLSSNHAGGVILQGHEFTKGKPIHVVLEYYQQSTDGNPCAWPYHTASTTAPTPPPPPAGSLSPRNLIP